MLHATRARLVATGSALALAGSLLLAALLIGATSASQASESERPLTTVASLIVPSAAADAPSDE